MKLPADSWDEAGRPLLALLINGPAYVTSRRRTAALASVVAGMMGGAMPAEADLRMGFKLEYRLAACWLISYRTV
jgi:hypothetical protein